MILNPQGTLSPQAWRITTPTNELISFNSTAQNAPDGFSFIPPGSIFPNGLTVSNVSGKDGFEFVCIGYDNSRPNEIIVAPPVELEVAGMFFCKLGSHSTLLCHCMPYILGMSGAHKPRVAGHISRKLRPCGFVLGMTHKKLTT